MNAKIKEFETIKQSYIDCWMRIVDIGKLKDILKDNKE